MNFCRVPRQKHTHSILSGPTTRSGHIADFGRSDGLGNDDTWHGSLTTGTVEGDEMHRCECQALDFGIYLILTLKDLQISVKFGARTATPTQRKTIRPANIVVAPVDDIPK